ncbi:MAG: hypothetical protein ABIJ59_04865 [Pseudomonadota bacterium]
MKKNYCIELDSQAYRLSGSALTTCSDIHSVFGCKFLVSDFDKSISRVMQIEADIKYAEALVVRALQDEGEFDEPVSVITHWKKKRGKKNTEIFFTALPSRIYLQYIDLINEHDDFLILIPVFSILTNLIKQVAKNETLAVVFRHDRFADIVIGNSNTFYFATRCVGFDASDEQIASLWETVSREISTAAEDNAIRINRLISLNWINSNEQIPSLHPLEIEQLCFNEETIIHENNKHSVSFTSALRIFPSMEGIAPQKGKLLHYANKLSPVVMAFFIITIAIHIWGTVSFQSKAKSLESTVISLENRICRLKKQIIPPPEQSEYMMDLKFVDALFHNRHLPSYNDVINDISLGIYPSTTVEQLDIEYASKQIKIKMNGKIIADFDTAYKNYQYLLSSLEKSGYVIDGNQFNTRIDSSQFDLSFVWTIQ